MVDLFKILLEFDYVFECKFMNKKCESNLN